jgi:pyridoxine kinase
MNLISIQSHVAYGHVGNSAAVFALQRLGCEVWPVHTVQFSNHTGYGTWKGEVFAAARIGEVIDGIADLGVLGACDGVLSGYIGAVETGEAIVAAVGKVKAANPHASYCCDPVIGNRARGEFVRPGVAEFMRERALPAAEVVTPNHFELDRLAGRETRDVAAVLSAVDGTPAARAPCW